MPKQNLTTTNCLFRWSYLEVRASILPKCRLGVFDPVGLLDRSPFTRWLSFVSQKTFTLDLRGGSEAGELSRIILGGTPILFIKIVA